MSILTAGVYKEDEEGTDRGKKSVIDMICTLKRDNVRQAKLVRLYMTKYHLRVSSLIHWIHKNTR